MMAAERADCRCVGVTGSGESWARRDCRRNLAVGRSLLRQAARRAVSVVGNDVSVIFERCWIFVGGEEKMSIIYAWVDRGISDVASNRIPCGAWRRALYSVILTYYCAISIHHTWRSETTLRQVIWLLHRRFS